MGDIRKNLTLTAQLDDSQLRKQLEVLKKEMGNTFSVDAGSLNDLKASIKDVAKEFGATLRKELEGIRGQRGKTSQGPSQKSDVNMSEITSMQVREMQVTNMVVNSITLKGASQGASVGGGSVSGLPSMQGGAPQEESPASWLKKNKTLLTVGAAGLAVQQGVSSLINIQQTVAERGNRMSRDFESGLGVEGIAREAGRRRSGLALTAGVGGAVAGGLTGAKVGAGLGSFFGPGLGTAIGAGVGGLAGAAAGGIGSYFGASNATGELNKEQVQLLSDAESRARTLSPLRQQMLAGGGISRGTMNDQMSVGARQYGMSGEDTLQTMLQAREVLGNKGASESFNQIMGNQRFLGIGAGTSAQSIETMAGAGGESRSSAANKQADVIKKGVAAGLDVSKSGKFLQTTMQYLQNSTGLGRTDTGQATTQLANLAAGFGGGQVTDTTLNQAQTLAESMRKESSSLEGISGAANLTGLQDIGSKAGGFDTGTLLALSKLQKNATNEDITSILSQNQGGAQTGDLADQVKQIQQFKNSDILGNFVNQNVGGNMGRFVMSNETGGTTQDVLGRERAMTGNITPEAMQAAGQAVSGAAAGVTQSPEFQLDVAQFTRSTESASKGLETFTTVTEQMTNQMKKLLLDLEAAQKRFDSQARSTGYGGIQNNR